jgi:hypothetical protein
MISRIISKRSRTQLRSLSILTPNNDDDTTPITKPLSQHHFPSRHQVNHPTTTTLYTTTLLFNHATPRPLHAPLISRAYFSTDNKKNNDEDSKDKKSSSSGPRLEARFGKLGAFFDRVGDEVGEELSKNKEIQEGLKELNKLKDDSLKSTEEFREQKVGGTSIDEQAEAAQEKAKSVSIQSERERCIAYMETTVVDISIPPPSFKPVSLSLSRISFILKQPKQVIF